MSLMIKTERWTALSAAQGGTFHTSGHLQLLQCTAHVCHWRDVTSGVCCALHPPALKAGVEAAKLGVSSGRCAVGYGDAANGVARSATTCGPMHMQCVFS